MLFKIKEIGDEGLSLNLPVAASWLVSECPDLDATLGPRGLTVRGQLLLSDDDVFLKGTLRGDLETSCARCLEKARMTVDAPLQVTFVPRETDGEEPDGDEEQDVDVASYDGEEIDLSPEVRDQLLLSLPIKPLCREDCAGLCPVCGGNRNRTRCACQPAADTPRTPLAAALSKLKM